MIDSEDLFMKMYNASHYHEWKQHHSLNIIHTSKDQQKVKKAQMVDFYNKRIRTVEEVFYVRNRQTTTTTLMNYSKLKKMQNRKRSKKLRSP